MKTPEIGKTYILNDVKPFWINGFTAKVIHNYRLRCIVIVPIDDDKMHIVSFKNLIQP